MTEATPRRVGGTILGRTPAVTTDGTGTSPFPSAFAGDEGDAGNEGEGTPTGASAPKISTGPGWLLVACVALALAALIFAILGLQQRSNLQAEEDQTNQLRTVSGQAIAALTSYDYQHLDQWKTAVLTNATGAFQTQFQASFSSFEQTYIAEHNRGTGTIQGIWVGPVASGKATTVVLVQITVTSLTGTHTLDPYVQVTLLKVAGRWRVDDIEATFDTGGDAGSGTSAATPSAASP